MTPFDEETCFSKYGHIDGFALHDLNRLLSQGTGKTQFIVARRWRWLCQPEAEWSEQETFFPSTL